MTEIQTFQRRPRSLIGPFILIGIGVVFLLQNLGVLSRHSIFLWFSRFWPLVLVIWGVVRLIEYALARKNNQPSPRIGPGSILFLIFFVLIGLAATRAASWNWEGMRARINVDPQDDVTDPFGVFGNRYEFTENYAEEIKPESQVKVIAARGNLTVTKSPDSQIHVFLHKYLRSDSQSTADRINGSTHPHFSQQGNTWVLDMTSGSYQEGRFNLDLQLPTGTGLSLSTNHGDISVSDREGMVEMEADHGDLSATGIKGNANLRLHGGSATVKNVSGNVNVDGRAEDIDVADIGGTLTMTGDTKGDIHLARLSRPLHFSSTRTDLQFAKLGGELSMESGELHANSITGPFQLKTRQKEVHVDDLSGDVSIVDEEGDIDLQAKAPLGNIDITNKAAEIKVTLPEKAAFEVEAQSDGGEIQSDFSLNINNGDSRATAKGTIGKGGPKIRLKTERGTIQLSKEQ
ncbi:MAG TPA: DUF4097 family beta strand repeat-containing protein [Candidatus Angelobacter sp.]|nr:DUF4097 family beta strand repeat-containing protein [Candidatus Angelobacter sp.]